MPVMPMGMLGVTSDRRRHVWIYTGQNKQKRHPHLGLRPLRSGGQFPGKGEREREREREIEREMTEKTITPSPTNPNAWSIYIDIRCKHKIIAIYIRCKPMSDLVGVGWGVTLASSFTGGRKGKM